MRIGVQLRLTAVSLSAATLALVGCGATIRPGDAGQTRSPRGVSSVAWANDGWIYFVEDVADAPDLTWRQRPNGTPEALALTSEGCAEAAYRFFSRGADGTVVAGRECGSGEQSSTELVTVADGKLVASLARFQDRLNSAAWNPRAGRGFVSRSNEVNACWSLAPADSRGVGLFRSQLTIDGNRWSADAYFRLGEQPDCTTMGDAGWPAMNAKAGTLYFFASGAAAGVSNSNDRRLSSGWLCAMTVDDQRVRPLASGFVDVRAIAVSDDNASVVVSATRSGDPGLWLVRPEGDAVERISSGLFGAVSVAPGGKSVVAVHHDHGDELGMVALG